MQKSTGSRLTEKQAVNGTPKTNQRVSAGYGCRQPQRHSGISAGCHLSPLGCHHETYLKNS